MSILPWHRRSPRLARRSPAMLAAGVLTLILLAGCGSSAPRGDHSSPPAASSHRGHGLRYLDPEFDHVTTTRNLAYGRAPGRDAHPQTLRLDLYQPAGDTVARRPAIVWVHGGSFCCGDKASGPSAILAREFAYLGYVTVSIDYRLLARRACVIEREMLTVSCEHDVMAAGSDAQAAVRWLRANATRYRIDATRIGIGGDSAGAVTATLVGLNAQATGDSGNPGHSSTVRAFMSLSGALPAGRLSDLGVSSATGSGLFFSGTADPTVPYSWSTQTASALQRDGVPAILVSFAGAGHDPYTQFQTQIDQESDYFFYTFMDMTHAQGSPSDAAAVFEPQMKQIARDDPAYARAVAASRARH